MTFQPPNQGNQPPAPPPGPGQPGQFGPPPGGGYPPPSGQGRPGGGAPFDPKTVNPLDWGILGATLLILIFSFFDYYTVTVSGGGFSASASGSAWHGFFGWFAVLLSLVGGGAIAVDLFAPQTKLPVAARLAALGAFALATISVILALFVVPIDDGGFSGVDTGHGFSYWASLILIIAALVLTLMRFQQTGGVLPGNMGSKVPNIGARGPQGGIHGGQPTPGGPAAGGYGTAPSPGAGPGPGTAGPGAAGPGAAGPGHPTPGNPGTGGQPPGSPPPPSYGPPSGS